MVVMQIIILKKHKSVKIIKTHMVVKQILAIARKAGKAGQTYMKHANFKRGNRCSACTKSIVMYYVMLRRFLIFVFVC